MNADARALRDSLLRLERLQSRAPLKKNELVEQPFDRLLLAASPLYRKSRERYLKLSGASARPAFLSTPRSLSSVSLLETAFSYSPVESEYFWLARGGSGTEKPRELLQSLISLRACVTSVFHEQNHRILWRALPASPKSAGAALRRYLNQAEAIVIAMDMALADELGPELAEPLHRVGAIYDLGTTLRQEGLTRRAYRNYLHAACDATYLILERHDPKRIEQAIEWLYPALPWLARRAAVRAATLEETFVLSTNLLWQKKNARSVAQRLGGPDPLVIPSDPFDRREAYLFTEQWFSGWGL